MNKRKLEQQLESLEVRQTNLLYRLNQIREMESILEKNEKGNPDSCLVIDFLKAVRYSELLTENDQLSRTIEGLKSRIETIEEFFSLQKKAISVLREKVELRGKAVKLETFVSLEL